MGLQVFRLTAESEATRRATVKEQSRAWIQPDRAQTGARGESAQCTTVAGWARVMDWSRPPRRESVSDALLTTPY
jgi:hypothetical protein